MAIARCSTQNKPQCRPRRRCCWGSVALGRSSLRSSGPKDSPDTSITANRSQLMPECVIERRYLHTDLAPALCIPQSTAMIFCCMSDSSGCGPMPSTSRRTSNICTTWSWTALIGYALRQPGHDEFSTAVGLCDHAPAPPVRTRLAAADLVPAWLMRASSSATRPRGPHPARVPCRRSFPPWRCSRARVQWSSARLARA
jgi:hypothetical protein